MQSLHPHLWDCRELVEAFSVSQTSLVHQSSPVIADSPNLIGESKAPCMWLLRDAAVNFFKFEWSRRWSSLPQTTKGTRICMNMEGNVLKEMKSIHKLELVFTLKKQPSRRNQILGTNFSYSSSSSKICIIKKRTRNNYNYKYCSCRKVWALTWTCKYKLFKGN